MLAFMKPSTTTAIGRVPGWCVERANDHQYDPEVLE
jgi:hypothetical protein